jgi:hypothetical protein
MEIDLLVVPSGQSVARKTTGTKRRALVG